MSGLPLQAKILSATRLLQHAVAAYSPAVLASSLGVEDMVLLDLISRHCFPIEVFSIDTGRLPAQTYELMQKVQQRYGLPLKIYFPKAELVEPYIQLRGVYAFYESVALRKECCHVRKVEPLSRALAGKRAWITGLRA